MTYDEAVEAQARLKADGVGFVIPDGYFFLDIDHKEADAPLSQKMLSRFNSYAEISPSGNGLHIYGMCDLAKMPLMDNGKIEKEFYQKNSKLGLELYIGGATNRFATFTGNAILDTALGECTTAVLETFDLLYPRQRWENPLRQSGEGIRQLLSGERRRKRCLCEGHLHKR